MIGAGVPPVMAILRGMCPVEARDIGRALLGGAIRMIEQPLNLPGRLESLARRTAMFGEDALIGVDRVISLAKVTEVAGVGPRSMRSPPA